MRRPIVLLASAAAGLAGVLGFHGSPTRATLPRLATSAKASGGAGRPPATSGNPGTTSTPPSSALPGNPTTPGASSSPPTTAAPQTARGRTENYGYGALAVEVTVKGQRISAVSVPSIQVADPTSQEYAQQAIPMLRSQVISAQSANISGVSGATYTSEAYATSLQSALNKLNFK